MRPPQFAGEDARGRRGAVDEEAVSVHLPPRTAGASLKPGPRSRCWPRFNEAPAVRGGRSQAHRRTSRREVTSMRPPQFAGEDHRADAGRRCCAVTSMRPPQFAGEDRAVEVHHVKPVSTSMRPPQFAGEDADTRLAIGRQTSTSMRPPQFAGEDLVYLEKRELVELTSMRPPQFAGEDRRNHIGGVPPLLTSMRPPQFAGEDRRQRRRRRGTRCHFNEAPAVRGGR